ncbi:hypothetical protein GQ53DRAFT_758018 [Thozetella sp. PMI_491]|nr:hypothetical protein GQ53DRAFT_758018 [Thozetella sp. PMI_491]
MRHNQRHLSTGGFLIALLSAIATANPLPQAPAGANIQEDTGQVAIHGDPAAANTATSLPISATIFAGVPGPKRCRGGVMVKMDLPPPNGVQTVEQCYNLPGVAGCGNFVANKGDGCEVRLFAEPACKVYMNTAVFMPEERAVGGQWRSFAIVCGKPPPDPSTLGAPPLADMVAQAKKTPKSGRRSIREELEEAE